MDLQFRSETRVADNGARVEVGTIVHEGREFANLGSIVDEAGGMIFAYVTQREGAFTLTTWEGATLAPLRKRGSWVNRRVFGGFPVRMFAWSATYNGRTYSGRNSGPGMCVRMRAKVSP